MNIASTDYGSMRMQSSDGTFWGAIAAGVLAAVAVLYRGYNKLRRDNQQDGTDLETLRALDSAVNHWRSLYETAWAQVAKERMLREAAELRVASAFSEIEKLRGEVAALRREVEKLTAR